LKTFQKNQIDWLIDKYEIADRLEKQERGVKKRTSEKS